MLALFSFAVPACTHAKAQVTLTIATVNNGDMLTMQRLSKVWEEAHPGIHLDWVVLEENTLREKATTDVAAHGGQYDVVTIGPLEAPIWGRRGWLLPLDNRLPAEYGEGDLLKPIRDSASYGGRLYALPFYGESSLTYYRKDLFAAAGLAMPAQPTYADIARFARVLNHPAKDTYGICLRGKPGWGENMAYLSTLANTFGGRWFDEGWRPQLNSPEWHAAVQLYIDLLHNYGPPGATSNGFNESLTLFENGRCAMWIDATVAAGALASSESKVQGTVGFASAPVAATSHGAQWLWFWGLAVPASSKHAREAVEFAAWATSREYIALAARQNGWAAAPSGTRKSTYSNAHYLAAAPFAALTERSIEAADPLHPTLKPVPYTGVQLVAIPSFPAIGNQVGQLMAAALAGKLTVEQALSEAQNIAGRVMVRNGEGERGNRNLGFKRPFLNSAQRIVIEGSMKSQTWLKTPAVAALALWSGAPLAMTAWFSFRRYNLLQPDRTGFDGWGNYRYLLTDPSLLQALGNTVLLVGCVLALTVGLGTLLALLFNQEFPGRGIARVLALAPFFVMPTVSALLWKNMMLHPDYGILAALARGLGLKPFDWFARAPLAAIIAMLTWQWLPFATLTLLTAVQSLDGERQEAARMDGAGPLQMLRYIIWPHLGRAVAATVMIETIFLLGIFAEIYVTTSGGPGFASTNLAFLIYRYALLEYDIGGAAVAGLLAILVANALAWALMRSSARGLDA